MDHVVIELVNEHADAWALDAATRSLRDDLERLDACTVTQTMIAPRSPRRASIRPCSGSCCWRPWDRAVSRSRCCHCCAIGCFATAASSCASSAMAPSSSSKAAARGNCRTCWPRCGRCSSPHARHPTRHPDPGGGPPPAGAADRQCPLRLGWPSTSSASTTLIVGLGYEKNNAEGPCEYFDPSEI